MIILERVGVEKLKAVVVEEVTEVLDVSKGEEKGSEEEVDMSRRKIKWRQGHYHWLLQL